MSRPEHGSVGGRRPVILVVVLAVLLLLIGVPLAAFVLRQAQNTGQDGPAGQATRGSGQQPSPTPLLWGMWIKDADGKPDPNPVIANREAALGHRLDVFHWYETWDSGWSRVGTRVETIATADRIPMITWEAFDRPPARIAKGDYDSYIDTWAQGAASKKPHELWIRIFHEFNDPQTGGGGYPWSIDANSAADLIRAWKHVHDRFVAAGADNVKWVWNPDGANQDKIQAGFPGDQYVDYTGWDTYGYDNMKAYDLVASISKKPMVIGEFGPESAQGTQLREFTGQIASGVYPRLHAVVYFDEGQYSIAKNPSFRDSLRQMLASPNFKQASSPAPS
jgi:glycosyl hydrolase family 26